MYRQGDVALFKVDSIPVGKKEKKPILAYGEVTGHRHEIIEGDVDLVRGNNGLLYLEVKSDTALLAHGNESQLNQIKRGNLPDPVKEDIHLPEEIEKGKYSVDIQEEYRPDGWNQMLD